MISYEELTGYFDLENEGLVIGPIIARSCLECGSVVFGGDYERHAEWHKSIYPGVFRSDKDKTPVEIRAEAKRELGRLKA